MKRSPESTVSTAELLGEWPEKQIVLMRHAYRLFGSKGMHQMTLQDVADAARVSKAVIIYYFSTKENLILRTLEWVHLAFAARITRAMDTAASPEGKVVALVQAIFYDPARNRNFFLAYTDLVASAARSKKYREVSLAFRSVQHATFKSVIRSGLDGGHFRVDDVDEAARVLRAIVDGLSMQWLQEPDWKQLHGVYRQTCVDSLLSYLGLRRSQSTNS